MRIWSDSFMGQVEITPTEPYFTSKSDAECLVAVQTGRFSGLASAWFRKADLERFSSGLDDLRGGGQGEFALSGRDAAGNAICNLIIRAEAGDLALTIDLTDRTHADQRGRHFDEQIRTGFGIDPDSLAKIQEGTGALLARLFDPAVALHPAPPDPPQPLDPTWPGLNWHFLARDWPNPGRHTYHLTGDGRTWFDELVVGDWLHMEWMSGRRWWMRLGDAMINVAIPRGGLPVIQIERDNYYMRPAPDEEAQALAEGDLGSDMYPPEADDQ